LQIYASRYATQGLTLPIFIHQIPYSYSVVELQGGTVPAFVTNRSQRNWNCVSRRTRNRPAA